MDTNSRVFKPRKDQTKYKLQRFSQLVIILIDKHDVIQLRVEFLSNLDTLSHNLARSASVNIHVFPNEPGRKLRDNNGLCIPNYTHLSDKGVIFG